MFRDRFDCVVLICAARALVRADVFVRATTRLVPGAVVVCDVAARGAAVFVTFFALRGTTRRSFVDKGLVVTTVSIRFEFWLGVTPGFKFVRILLFIYGYI